MRAGADGQLLARLLDVEERVRLAVDHRRGDDPTPDDPFRGLYVNDETVERLLAGVEPPPEFGPGPPLVDDPGPLMTLARHAGLTAFDLRLLVIAMVPDLDSRFEKLYGYLNDDVTRRRASIGLALELAGASATSASARRSLSPVGPLVDLGLVLVEDPDRPYLTRSLRVPDRVVSHLLGDTSADASIQHVLLDVEGYPSPLADRLGHALGAGAGVIHVREREAGTGAATAVAALEGSGRAAVVADLTLLARGADPDDLVRACARETLIRGAGLVAGPVEALAESHPESIPSLSRWPSPVIFVGAATWDPLWSTTPPLAVEAPILGARERITLLRAHLERAGADVDPDSLAAHLSLGPAQVQRAVHAAQTAALLGTGRITSADLRSGIRAQNAAGLERLSRRIEPEVTWHDLVLAPAVRQALEELTARARHRDQVLVDWRMRKGGGRGRGVSALFAGDSGTGKTMSAEVIAADLGLDLYTVNLATVVDKYVGETEKNLERIFAEAGGVNAVLFFDEADAIFGKRSEVRDAHDRYANIESAYLLQRLETFDGLAVLATNLRANIDEAFTRRLDAIVDFPAPTADLREALWRQCLGPPPPAVARRRRHVLRQVVRARRRQHPLGRDHRGVPGRRRSWSGHDGACHRRRGSGVPQARPLGAREGVRPLPRPAHRVSGDADLAPSGTRACTEASVRAPRQTASSDGCWSHSLSREESSMREHQFDTEEAGLRPKASRMDEPVSEQQGRAAAEGRADVLGEAGVIGLQRAAGNGAVASIVDDDPSPVHEVISSGGRPLEPDVRADMEGRLGHDFGDVRVHDDSPAHSSAQAVNAHAYTVGSNVVFQRDQYDPSSDAGRTMLAHELTHVVQQRSGPVDGTPTAGGIKVSDPSDRFEREAAANAERVMAAPAPAQPAPPAPTPAAAVQREVEEDPPVQRAAPEEEEEETAQGSFVQRAAPEEEQEEEPAG